MTTQKKRIRKISKSMNLVNEDMEKVWQTVVAHYDNTRSESYILYDLVLQKYREIQGGKNRRKVAEETDRKIDDLIAKAEELPDAVAAKIIKALSEREKEDGQTG